MTAHARAVLIVTLATAATFAALACCGHQFNKSEEARYEAGRPHSVCLLNVELPDETPEIKLAYNGFDVSFNPLAPPAQLQRVGAYSRKSERTITPKIKIRAGQRCVWLRDS